MVTGATGLLGAATAIHLAKAGHEVISVDRRPGPAPYGTTLVIGDLSDLAFCDSVIAGADAVAHLGAIPNPIDPRQYEVFHNNTSSTFAVFTAAAQAKCRTVVYASSISAYGTAYSEEWRSPLYAPVDEIHPLIYEESYALSKEVNELSAVMWSRRCETSFVGLRFPWTNTPEKTIELAKRFRADETLPPDPRFPPGIVEKILWGYLDLRDATRAIEIVLTSETSGADIFNFCAPDTMVNEATVELMAEFHPTTELRGGFSANEALITSQKFVTTFGYEARYLLNRRDL